MREADGVSGRLIRWEAGPRYAVAFTTRCDGVSDGPFGSLNLGRLTADDPVRVEENRRRVCEDVGAGPEQLVSNRQVHGSAVHRADPARAGEEGDGLWTDEPGVPVLALTADCVPVALARTDGPPAVAVVHAGWRGLLAGVIESGARAIGGAFAAVIGPSIGPCCYEVGREVSSPAAAAFGADVVDGAHLDLWTATERALLGAGAARVDRLDLCTACHPELFFSHRRDNGLTGRQGVIAHVLG